MAAFVFSVVYLNALLVLPAFSRMIMLPDHLMHGEIAEELCAPAGTCIGRPGESLQVKSLGVTLLSFTWNHVSMRNRGQNNHPATLYLQLREI